MLRRAIAALFVVVSLSLPLFANGKAQGWCEDGGRTITVSGVTSSTTTPVQRSFASCTVTVYNAGTLTLATIYADDAGTAKANPFTAASTGQWFFYAIDGRYDVRLSSGGIATPFTLGDFQIIDASQPGNIRIACAPNFTGANAGAQIVSARADLPATGGVVDARCFQGSQSITQDIFAGSSKPTMVLFGAADYAISGASWTCVSGSSIVGIGSSNTTATTTLSWNGTGRLIDRNVNTSPGCDNIGLYNLRINVSASGAGAIRVGDRTASYLAAGNNDGWVIDNVEIYGQAVGIGLDFTQLFNSNFRRITVNNFATNMQLTTVSQSVFDGIVLNTCASRGLYILNTQPSAVLGQMDGTIFSGLTSQGIGNATTAIEIDSVGGGLEIDAVFIERVSLTPTAAVRVKDSLNIELNRITVSGSASFANVFSFSDSSNITLSNSTLADVNDVSSTSTATWTAANRKYATNAFRGGIFLRGNSRSVNRMLTGIPWVVIDGWGARPGRSSFNQPLTGVTGLWSKSLANRQGVANVADSDFYLDAFTGQNVYDSGNSATPTADAAASIGYAIQVANNDNFGFEFPYPGNITLGTYELIVRGKVSTGTAAPSIFVDSVGVGNIFNTPWAVWTTTYQVFSARFSLTSANVGAGTAIRVSVVAAPGAGNTFSVDYMALRPAMNDVVLHPYVAPASQINDTTGAAILGSRLSLAASIPTTGAYVAGDFVFSSVPTGANGNTIGWSRLTTSSTHVVGTDWAVVVSPDTTLSASASLDFAAWAGVDCQTLTIPVTGAAEGDVVKLGIPNGLGGISGVFWPTPWVSAANTVSIEGCKLTAGASGDPPAYTVRVVVEKY